MLHDLYLSWTSAMPILKLNLAQENMKGRASAEWLAVGFDGLYMP
jgi:hypothetical protein